jgi:hypothetical protein
MDFGGRKDNCKYFSAQTSNFLHSLFEAVVGLNFPPKLLTFQNMDRNLKFDACLLWLMLRFKCHMNDYPRQ